MMTVQQLHSQSLPDSVVQKVDNLFSRWDKKNSPGCAIGIIRNDSLIYSHGFGMADLENSTPIGSETMFYMTSASQQFTAYSIILLARQGKINLDENIRIYLSWMPDFGRKITVRNLLNNTSGIRDDLTLCNLTGLSASGTITQQFVVNLIKMQRSLNFFPGEKLSYSNSNYILLAEIIKAVSGKSLRQFADSAIFKPLGMLRSRFVDKREELIENRAMSYQRIDSIHYADNFQTVFTNGDGGLFTTVADMAKWATNFYKTTAGDASDIAQLTQTGKLNNGSSIEYAPGMSVQLSKGWKTFTNTGALHGYRTALSVLPDLKMGFICVSNLGDFDLNKINQVINLFVKDSSRKEAAALPVQADTNQAIITDTSAYKKYMGDHIDDDGVKLYFFMKDKKIYVMPNPVRHLLIKSAADTFYMQDAPNVKFVFGGTEKQQFITGSWDGTNRLFNKYDIHAVFPDEELRKWAGTYYAPELDCRYRIELRNNRLILINQQFEEFPLILTGPDHFFSRSWWINDCKVVRNTKGQIQGFEINDERARNLRFNKLD